MEQCTVHSFAITVIITYPVWCLCLMPYHFSVGMFGMRNFRYTNTGNILPIFLVYWFWFSSLVSKKSSLMVI